jgi:hypothetical protein
MKRFFSLITLSALVGFSTVALIVQAAKNDFVHVVEFDGYDTDGTPFSVRYTQGLNGLDIEYIYNGDLRTFSTHLVELYKQEIAKLSIPQNEKDMLVQELENAFDEISNQIVEKCFTHESLQQNFSIIYKVASKHNLAGKVLAKVNAKKTYYKRLVLGTAAIGLAGLAYWQREAIASAANSAFGKVQGYLPTKDAINAQLKALGEAIPTKESIKNALPTKEGIKNAFSGLSNYLPSKQAVADKFNNLGSYVPTKEGVKNTFSNLASYIPSKKECSEKLSAWYNNLWKTKATTNQ